VTCMAEGLVDGQRRSVRLPLERTSRTSVYALKQRPPVNGAWMLVITTTEGGATALVDLGDQGEVLRVRVPTQAGQPWPRAVTREEIDASLQQRAGM
jgi:hypothetical protein